MDYENHAKKQKNIEPVPYIAYESAIARLERINKRVWAINIMKELPKSMICRTSKSEP